MSYSRYNRNDFFIAPELPLSFKGDGDEHTFYATSFRRSFLGIVLPISASLPLFYFGWTTAEWRPFLWGFGIILFGIGLQDLLRLKNKISVSSKSLKIDSFWGSKTFSFLDFESAALSFFYHKHIGARDPDILTVTLSLAVKGGNNVNVDLSLYPSSSRSVMAILKHFYPERTYSMEWIDQRNQTRSVMDLADGSVNYDIPWHSQRTLEILDQIKTTENIQDEKTVNKRYFALLGKPILIAFFGLFFGAIIFGVAGIFSGSLGALGVYLWRKEEIYFKGKIQKGQKVKWAGIALVSVAIAIMVFFLNARDSDHFSIKRGTYDSAGNFHPHKD